MLTLFSHTHGHLTLTPSYPPDFDGAILPGSQPYSWGGESGSIVIQEVTSEQYSIRYTIARFFEKMVIRWKEEKQLRALFALQNELTYLRDEQTIVISPAHFNLSWAPDRETTGLFSTGAEYRLFCALYSPELVKQLHPDFPAGIPPEENILPIEHTEGQLMQQILSNPYQHPARSFFFENKIREILLGIFSKERKEKDHEGFSADEVARVRAIDQLILQDLRLHYTIPQLARRAKMPAMRLKLAYRKVIGTGMFERLKEARLQKAKELLLQTDMQVKVIYDLVGYESITGFIDAFRERFGDPPIAFRKKHGPKH